MGNDQSKEKMTYEELSNAVYSAFEKNLQNEADYFWNGRRRERFVNKQIRKNPKERFNRDSYLAINFSKQKDIYLLNFLQSYILPDLYSLELENLNKNVGKFEYFFTKNFPERLEHFTIEKGNIDFSILDPAIMASTLRRIHSSITLNSLQL
mmetsp:Transcript_21196/g.18818  ORF Transcript_21196/g.18818 Transcript_21196/m.18818 type:complete len:152 (+) Transcript_21196:11-466(+)